jgi:glycosyltransferase involved in cell wall biosynthesis
MKTARRTILSVAYPFAEVGSGAVGGAEQILGTLEKALVRRGFQSIVAAHARSEVAGELLGVAVPHCMLNPEARAGVELRFQQAIDRAFATKSVDMVHMHGIDFHRYRIPQHVPVLVTLHLPPAWYPAEIWDLPANYQLQCVSESQRAACPRRAHKRLVVVQNGVPLPASAATRRGRGKYAVMLSRICAEKNLHTGMDAARMADVPVIVAGKVYPYPDHVRYFEEEIRPRIGKGARFVGPVDGEAKARLLSRARCLQIPSLAEETSSLVAMEALAAGTPVVALPSGAIPDIVEDGRTGFLVRDAESMATAIARAGEIDSQLCRAVARERFSADAMVAQYLNLYAKLIG